MLPAFVLTILIFAVEGAPLDQYIINGTTVTNGDIPYQVYFTNSGTFRCSGIVYDSDTILTVAHCVKNSAVSNLLVVCGKSERNATGGQSREVSSYTIHENFADSASDGYANNLASVKLSSAFTLNSNCASATLPANDNSDYAGDVAVFSGWGFYDNSMTKSQTLRRGNVTVLSNSDCSTAWGSLTTIVSSHLCVKEANFAACMGDSGGPVTINGTVVGLLSFGDAACGVTFPEVATRLSKYSGWISSNTSR